MSSAPITLSETAPARRRRFTVDSLFTDHRPQAVGVVDLPTAKEIQLDRIEPDPEQPRRTFDEAKLAELEASIRIEGVLQPIVVRYAEERDIYVIVHGERRWRASRAAGLPAIPALVRDVPESRRLIQQLMENIVRDDLNAVDRAAALRVLKTQLGDAPWEQVAEAVGIRRSRLFQLLGTEKLPEHIQADIRAGRISEKQSRALQGLPPGHQAALRDVIVADDLPADEAMRLARELKAHKIGDDPGAAADALARFRAPRKFINTREDELGLLLAAVADAASGGSHDRAALKRLADEREIPPFDEDRLVTETLALARSLARTPRTELRPGASTFAALAALYGALDAALSNE
ncbi:MAG: ParB/RepB/Spo0J family partition protein [Thermomicrobiales bacterium]|nr:ParB/RepB/Spo0J family partition protein [Thermomicrobiales bacterium]